MLGSTEGFSSFAVPDLEQAKTFYGQTLGLKVSDVEEMGLLRLQIADGRDVMVYPKPDHAPANYTILNFPVDDIKQVVDALTELGVSFERYDGFEQDEKGIAHGDEGPAIAWFTDPAGNILAVMQDS
jgi:predicted enzyme related to lactoylglutathione lyase